MSIGEDRGRSKVAGTSTVVKLTKHVADRATPVMVDGIAVKQRLYFDTEVKGFGLCVGKKLRSFFVQRRKNGRQQYYTFARYGEKTVDEAREEARELTANIGKGLDVRAPNGGITLAEALELWKSTNTRKGKPKSPRTIADHEYRIDTYLADWRKRPLVTITREEVDRKHQKIKHDVATGVGAHVHRDAEGNPRPHRLRTGEVTADQVMHAFRGIYNRARDRHAALPECPTARLRWWKSTYVPRRAAIPYDQLPNWYSGVMAKANPVRRDLLLLMMLTGLRSGDAKRLRWADIDLKGRRFAVTNPKSGEPFHLPLTRNLVALLKARLQHHRRQVEMGTISPRAEVAARAKAFVFPADSKSGHVSEVKEPINGVPYIPHGLRNTFGTVAEYKAGVPGSHVSMLMDHHLPDRDMTQRYQNPDSVEDLRASMERIDAAFRKLFATPKKARGKKQGTKP